jgi:hypothetical protein
MEVERYSEMMVHSIITLKNTVLIFATMNASNLMWFGVTEYKQIVIS